MPWVNLLSSSPVAIPSANNRAVYVLHFKGDISASQVCYGYSVSLNIFFLSSIYYNVVLIIGI